MVQFVVDLLNFLIKALGAVLGFIVNILPTSPFQGIINNNDVKEFLSGLAWIIPFNTLLGVFQTWVTCVLAYYLYSIVMRWLKMIE